VKSKLSRSPISPVFIWLLLILIFIFRPGTQGLLAQGALAKGDDLASVWERARAAGAYTFRADITQKQIPLATVSNVGRSSRATSFYLEGETDPGADTMQLTLWSGEGSVLDAGSGITVRVDGDDVQARQGERGEWQTLEDFGGLFAPEGDFMAYLVAARDVESEPAADGRVHYTFTVDGPRFAAYLGEQMREQMAAAGELVPNMPLELPRVYAEVTGEGELWVGADGLPRRQEITLHFPEAASPQEGTRLDVHSAITFSGFASPATASSSLFDGTSLDGAALVTAVSQNTRATLPAVTAALALLLFLVMIVRHSDSRRVYAALAVGLIIAMLFGPLLQTIHAQSFSRRQAQRAAASAARQEESQMQQDIARAQEEGREASALPDGALEALRNDDGRDSDGDGLSDVVESLRGDRSAATVLVDGEDNELFVDQACLDTVAAGYTAADADADGLTDYEECVLGTSSETSTYRDGVTLDGVDSDGDTIPDLWEVTGYSYAGRQWYTNPLERDTNTDTLPDTLEWEFDDDGDGEPEDGNGDGIPDMRDTDGDGIPDLFDDDNDGDGVPDRLDTSPFTASATPVYDNAGAINGYQGQTFGEDTPLELQLDDLAGDTLSFVEFQLRPTDPDHLWYALNVLDWPENDRRAQIQDDDGLTFLDVNTGDQAAANDGYGDMKLVPMLEIHIPGSNAGVPDESVLRQYGITVREDTDGYLAYVPLYVVAEEKSDEKVAFSAKMVYLPGSGWNAAHEVRMVWLVQALVDRCESYEYEDDDGETQQSTDCQTYSAYNELEVIHVYDNDPWYLTGFNVREDHGVEFATIYEDPAVDPDLLDDEPLTQLAQGFDYTFLAARDCSGDDCQADGERDITVDTIYNRWNRTSNATVPDVARWDIPDILRVQRASYDNIDEALATVAMTDTVNLLDSAFGAPPGTPVTPTLLFAREETYRATSLDSLGLNLSWSGSRLTVDMDPALVPLEVLAGLNWAPYQYENSAWASLPLEAYWDELARRYGDAFSTDDDDVAQGKLVGVQLYYTGLYLGVNRLVEIDGDLAPVVPSQQAGDKPLAASILKGLGSAANTIVGKFVLARAVGITVDAADGFWRYLREVFRYTYDEALGNNWIAFRDNIGKLTKLSGWRLNLAAGAIMLAVLAVVAVAIILSFTLGGNEAGRWAVAITVGVLMVAMTVVGPVLELIEAVGDAVKAATGAGKIVAVGKALGSLNTLSKASKAANIIGLIVSIGVAIGVFIYQMVQGGYSFGSPEANYLLAFAISAIIVAVVLFILSLTIVGAIIVALLAIVDIVLLIAGVDFSIITWLTETLTDFIYAYSPILDTEDVELGSLGMELDYADRGMAGDNTLSYETEITTTVVMTDPDFQAKYYVGNTFFVEEDIDDTVFLYGFSPYSELFSDSELANGSNEWETEVDRSWLGNDLYRGRAVDDVAVSGIALPVGINQSPDLYLNNGYDIPAYECWSAGLLADLCYTRVLTGSDYVNLGDSLYYDVVPPTIGEFVALDWAGAYQSFPAAQDHDGDGQPVTGLDPDDEDWDVDDDGLADGFEIELRGRSREEGGFPISYLSADTDADGLCDGDEIVRGTDPADRDTDGDGLTDAEEVWHRDCATGDWGGGWTFTYLVAADAPDGVDHSMQIFSDPLKADADGDGFTDQVEKLIHEADPAGFPFHPEVYNDSPGGLYPSVSELDGVLYPGQTLAYTLTVRNNFPDPYWVFGGVTVTVPSLLGGGVYNDVTYDPDGDGLQAPVTDAIFNLFPGNTARMTQNLQADNAAGSTTTTISNSLRSQLNRNGDVSYDWIVNQFALNRDTPTTGYIPWSVKLAAAPTGTGWGTPYVAAVIESEDLSAPYEFEVVLYELDDIIAGRTVVDTFVMDPDEVNDYGTPRADVACAADGDCLVVYNYFDSNDDDSTQGLHVGGVQVDPNGIVANSDFTIGQLADTDNAYSGDLLWPTVAGDGTRFWLAYEAESYSGVDPDKQHVILARRAEDDGTLGTPGRVDENDNSSPADQESYVDMAWIGGNQLILTWSTPDDEYNVIHKALIDDSATLVAGSYENVTSFGDTPQIAYESSINRGVLVFREREPQIDNENIDEYAIRAFFIEGGDVTYGWRPAGDASPDDIVHSPSVAYDFYNEGWVIGWIGQKDNDSTLYFNSYNVNDSLSRISEQSVQLTGILPPDGLSFACQPEPPVLNLTDCRVAGSETPTVGGELFWQKVILELDSPFYGPFDNEAYLDLIIDDDEPSSGFINLPAYVQPDETIIIGGEATDPTSSVARVQVSVDGGAFTTAAAGANAASWVYAWDTGPGERAVQLRVRAVDAADNVQSTPTGQSVIVDGTAPQAAVAVATGDVLAPQQQSDDSWTLPLNGTVADPQVGGVAGSGIASVEISVSPAGSTGGAWQPLTWDAGGNWQIDYPLAAPARNSGPFALTGQYSIRLRTADNLDNRSLQTLATIGVDNKPPEATLETIGGTAVTLTTVVTDHPVIFNQSIVVTSTVPAMITQSVPLAGTASDTGAAGSGIAGVDLSYTPFDFLTSPFAGTALETQLWNSAALTTVSPTLSTWSATVPEGMEGFFNLDARATDGVGNAEDAPASWTQWSGEIDTDYPRVTADLNYGGWASTARTEYDVTVEDLNLVEEGFRFDVCVPPGTDLTADNRGYYSSSWADAFLPEARLTQLRATCIEPGLITEAFRVQGCDAFGRCTGRDFEPDFNLYVAGNSRVLSRTDNLGNGAETAAVLDAMNRPVYAIDGGTLTYVAHNNTPAAAIRQSNLDGSAESVLATLRPGSGSAHTQQVIAAGLVSTDDYGEGVALSADGNTLVVSDGGVYGLGFTTSVYIFERSGNDWVEAAILNWELDDTDSLAFLSASDEVAVNADGSVIAVGDRFYDTGGTSSAGAVIIYERSGSSWNTGFNPTPVARLVASDATANRYLGSSVAMTGTTVVAGAFNGDAFYVFEEPGGGWASGTESARVTLPASGVDHRVAIDGNRIAVGHGAGAYVYSRNGASWLLEQTLSGAQGPAVALSGNTVLARNEVFTYDGGSWSRQAVLPAAAADVALQGDVAVLGDGSSAARVFVRRAGGWVLDLTLTPPDAAGDYSSELFINGDTIAVGAPDGGDFSEGQLYLYRIGTGGLLFPPDIPENDGGHFARSVAVDGDTMVVGAILADQPGTIDVTGVAFVFFRRDNVWYLQQVIFAPDGQDADLFGMDVDVDGDTIVVGAPGSSPAGTQTGAAYFFTRSNDVWSYQDKVINPRSDNGYFGNAVALSGDTAVVGSPYNLANEGQAWVYTRSGSSWNYAATLSSTDAQGGTTDYFGWDVALEGDTIAVSNQGTDTVYAYTRPGSGWASTLEDARLEVSGQTLGEVAVSGDTIVALGNALYLFAEPAGGWSGTRTPQQSLADASGLRSVALDGDRLVAGGIEEAFVYARDEDGVWSAAAPVTVTTPLYIEFGGSVDISGGTIVVGAEQTDLAKGAAYAFDSVDVAAVDANADAVAWAQSTREGQALLRHDLGASVWQRATLAGPSGTQVYLDVALDEAGNSLYWSQYEAANPGQGQLVRADLADGANATTLAGPGPRPHSLVLNELEEKLYWTADLQGELSQANLDGSGATTLYSGLSTPTGLDLLPAESAVYWVEQPGGSTVMRGDLAATTPVPVITLTATFAGIAVDQNYLPVANDQTASTTINESIQISLDAYDPDDDPLSFTIVASPGGFIDGTGPDIIYTPGDDFTGTDSFTYRVDDGRGGTAEATVTVYVDATPARAPLAASETFTEGTNLVLNVQSLDDYVPPARDSVIFSPADGTVFTTLDAIPISGAAYAASGLQGLILWVDNNVVAVIPYNGVITDTTWSVNWTPPGDGQYVLESAAVEVGSILEGARTPVTITVDTLPPSITIDNNAITTDQQVAGPLVEVSGTASDLAGVSRVEFRYETPGAGYGPWQVAEYDPVAETWRYELSLGTLVDDVTVFVGARAFDYAGNVAETGDAISVDLQPPSAVTLTAAYEDGGQVPLAEGDLVPLAAPTLVLAWTESSDGSFSIDYRAGWSTSPDPADPWLDEGNYSSAGEHSTVVNEAQTVYGHLELQDAYGNVRTQTFGPVYVDGPLTPDLVSDLDYAGWQQSGNTLLSADYEIWRRTPPTAALHRPQRLYGSWDENALRLTWQGAAWSAHGDLFLYLDTGSGGAMSAYDPYTPAGPPVTLPDSFAANYAVWVQDTLTATLLSWNGGGWTTVQALDAAAFRYRPAGGTRTSDVLLPFSLLGIANPATTELGVVALAVEEGAHRTWGAAPDQNPLNSDRVVEPLATGYTANGYALTQALRWTSLGSGVAPNGGLLPGSDLHVTIAATPGGLTAGYLDSDWLDLLTPGSPLDADLDGQPDVPLPAPAAPLPLGDGSAVSYTVTIANEGDEAATGIQVELSAHGALELAAPGPLAVGTIPAGDTVTFIIEGTVDTALNGSAAELNAVVADDRHGSFEWLWAHHPVDSTPPVDLAVTAPVSYVLPFTNVIGGVVADPAGVPLIDLEIRTQPGDALATLSCADATPYDGAWQCPYNFGDLDTLSGVEVRAQATDSFGQTGPWSAWYPLAVDTTPPTVSLTTDLDLILQDGFLSRDERLWQGLLEDDYAPHSVELCLAGTCRPAGAAGGTWQQYLPLPVADGLRATVVITGQDVSGNVSAPLQRSVVIDTVPPVLTVDQAVARTTITGAAQPATILRGTYSDGGGLAEIYARIQGPAGDYWTAARRSGDSWRLAPEVALTGDYIITLQAYDRAGNASSYGPFHVTVTEEPENAIYLPFVAREGQEPMHLLYLPVVSE